MTYAAPIGPPNHPLRPDLVVVTPPELVATLTRPERFARVRRLVELANLTYELAIAEHGRGREIVATCILFSGGNDSTVLAHLFRYRATHAIHANTTIGIEATRQYVRDTCAAWRIPLIEETPPDSFEDLVLGRVTSRAGVKVWPGAFPGPAAHAFIYGRIKERALDKARHTLGIARSKSKAAVWVAGRRRQESDRRVDIPLHEADGTVIWTSPLAMWTKLDLNTYRLMFLGSSDEVPTNPVTEHLHMSGECLCGAFAKPGELDQIRYWYPDVAAEIEDLQERALAAGFPEARCQWGHGIRGRSAPAVADQATTGAARLCSSCEARAHDHDTITS